MKNHTYRTLTLFSALLLTALGASSAEAMRRYHHNATPVPGDEAPFPCAMAQHQPLLPSPTSPSHETARQDLSELEKARQNFGPYSPLSAKGQPLLTLADRIGYLRPGVSLVDQIPTLLSNMGHTPSTLAATTSTASQTGTRHPLARRIYGTHDHDQTTPYILRPVREDDVTPLQDPAASPEFFYMGDVPFAVLAKIDTHIRNVVGTIVHEFWVLEESAGAIKGYFDYRDEATLHLHKALHGQGIARQVHSHLLRYFEENLGVPTLKIAPNTPLGLVPVWAEAIDALVQASAETFPTVFKTHLTATSVRYAGFKANLCYPNVQALALFANGMSIQRCREGAIEAVFPPRPNENPRTREVLTQLIAVNRALRGPFVTRPVEAATAPTREELESTRATLISALRRLEENDDDLPQEMTDTPAEAADTGQAEDAGKDKIAATST